MLFNHTIGKTQKDSVIVNKFSDLQQQWANDF